MAWGPPGETRSERIDFKSKEEFLAHINNPAFVMKSAVPMLSTEFAEMIREGDELYFEGESNNHRGYKRIVGRRKSGITYAYVLSSWMS